MYIDTHCHLDFPEFDQDREAVIKGSKAQGIDFLVNVGASLKSSGDSLELAKKYPFVYASIGIHPHEADRFNAEDEKKLRAFAQSEKVVAIGEIGLDYYRNFSRPENQKPLFLALLKLAKDLNLPLVIHTRQAENDTLEILKKMQPISAVVHCFSGDTQFLKACLDLGFFISFTCNITYKKAEGLRQAVAQAPLERIFLETDAPYLAPEGLRGKRNEPINVKYVAAEIARVKGVSAEEVARATSENAKNFFKLK
ncbi:MAG: TatD family hydrolase [Candidatus Omnitrophica bacterium]|nr:TatD family hydrolase [Candidatus Omnitrophota bacterium]MDD5653230.1 TatD family hydrolase [Candidatus Omnitrophota bacterium]